MACPERNGHPPARATIFGRTDRDVTIDDRQACAKLGM
jgi:hypothetical protein